MQSFSGFRPGDPDQHLHLPGLLGYILLLVILALPEVSRVHDRLGETTEREDRRDILLLDAMMARPILINRPIVVSPKGVRLCCPSEQVLDLLPPQQGEFVKEDGERAVDEHGRRVAMAGGAGMSTFERYLTLWVALCIVAGVALGHFIPGVSHTIGAAEIAKVNLPIAALIWLLLPVYLGLLLDEAGRGLIHIEPFVHAFIWLIAVPLLLAGIVQAWARRSSKGAHVGDALGLLPVPPTAVVLFVVVCSVVPHLDAARASAVQAVPIYVAFAVLAPFVGLAVGRLLRLPAAGLRAVAFSAATRNSLVVLPLGLAVPGSVPVLPAIIVTQTLVELLSELVYVRFLPKIGKEVEAQRA